MARKRMLECTECGGTWSHHPKIKSWSSNCPFCKCREFFTGIHLLLANVGKRGHYEIKFCNRCSAVMDFECLNCGNKEFTLLNLRGFYLDDCFFDPSFESCGQRDSDSGEPNE